MARRRSRSWRSYDYYYFPKSTPREAKGGIKAQSKRFGESWWAQRWIAVLESFYVGARLQRGRSYARSGQVLSIDVDSGVVKSKVQGSRPKPYDITIKVKVLSADDWKRVAHALSRQALFAARLLAGEMPQEIEQVFKDAGLSLFPEKVKDLTTDCSCPDWSNPCKHIAAVYYLLGEEFDRDPFLIFKMRGMSREELVGLLGDTAVKATPKPFVVRHGTQWSAVTPPPEPLSADVPDFWSGKDLPEDLFGDVQSPPVQAALPKRLGSFPFWRSETRFMEAMETVYPQASQRGMGAFIGERDQD